MTLREHIAARGCTHAQAARGIGVSLTRLRGWLSGKREPSFAAMRLVFDWSLGQVTPNDWVLCRGGADGK